MCGIEIASSKSGLASEKSFKTPDERRALHHDLYRRRAIVPKNQSNADS